MQNSRIYFSTPKQILPIHPIDGVSIALSGPARSIIASVANTVLTTQSAPPPPHFTNNKYIATQANINFHGCFAVFFVPTRPVAKRCSVVGAFVVGKPLLHISAILFF